MPEIIYIYIDPSDKTVVRYEQYLKKVKNQMVSLLRKVSQ